MTIATRTIVEPHLTPSGTRPQSRLVVPAVGGAFLLYVAIFSPGFYEADELTHFLMARDSWHEARGLLDIWGRPACTGLYALVVPFGLVAARLMAAAVTALVALGTLVLAQRFMPAYEPELPPQRTSIRRHATAWLCILLLAQPALLINCSFMMTEMLLACMWVWAAVLLVRHRILGASLLIGMAGLARPEGWFAIVCWPMFLWLYHHYVIKTRLHIMTLIAATVLAVAPVAAWYCMGVGVLHSWRWVLDWWPWAARSQYGKTPLKFLAVALGVLALWMWIPLLVTTRRVLTAAQHAPSAALFLLVLPVAGFFTLHGVLGTFGLFGSLSMPRYFLAIAPMLAIMTFLGLVRMQQTSRNPAALPWYAGLLAAVPLVGLICLGQFPPPQSTAERKLDVAIAAVSRQVPPAQYATRLIASNPYVFYRMNIRLDTPVSTRNSHPEEIRNAPPGTILITDSGLWDYEGRPNADQLRAWGYTTDPVLDAQIDAVPQRLDITTLKGGVTVRVWMKR